MNFSISLEDETRAAIETLGDSFVITETANLSCFKLLHYLDPYGDTIFNRYQIDDLIIDLERLNEPSADTIISQIISLARRCKDETHTYLSFNGD